ncbi:MAG: response regulator [Pseudomonadota bacterium]|nr:response regulator [Pseudomonadota bacterium]
MKVLIVDDEPLVRYTLKRVLESLGDTVVLAVDGQQGLDAWLKVSPDLTFLDIIMPKLTGPEVLIELGNRKTGKVVMMSAFTGEQSQETAKQVGADDFIEKPFDDIFAVVKRAKELV